MAAFWDYDTTNKLFALKASALDGNGELTIDAVEAYSTVKQDWKDTDELWKFEFPLVSIGGQGIGGGVEISPYISLKSPWKIKPPEADSSITIVGNVITEDGSDPFVGTTGTWDTVVKYVVSGNSLAVIEESTVTADDVWDEALEGTYTARELLRLISAALAGEVSGADTTTVTIRDITDTKDRITATVDTVGNRSTVTVDAT